MGWSYFWIGDFDLDPGAPTPRAFSRPPKSGALTIDHLHREGARMLFLRVEDRDATTEDELTAAVRGLKRKNAGGRLSCIAWEDGPEDYGVTWPVSGRRRKLTRVEARELFAAHVETMRAIVDEAAVRLATADPAGVEREGAPPDREPAARARKPRSAEQLVAALEKGQPGARANALTALADVDSALARKVAFEWLARWEGVYEPGRWVHQPKPGFPAEPQRVNREKQLEAAIAVLARDLDDAAVDALLSAKPYHPSGSHLARDVLGRAKRDDIAQKICARLVPGLPKTHIHWYLRTLAECEHVGDVDVLRRMLRDPLSFEPTGERFDSLRIDALRVFWWARHPEAVALTCELLGTEPFSQHDHWFTSKLDDLRIDFPRLLASPLLPHDKISAEVLEGLRAAANPEPELTPQQIRDILRDARREAGGSFDDT